MCGICGVICLDPSETVPEPVLKQMNQTLYHRGPDDEGYYIAPGAGLAIRRLSIIDLATGRQPMANEDQTVWVVFNGEIYNYREVRRRLQQKGHLFATQADTEVIVHAYEEYGDDCLDQFNGMFGLAVWDAPRRRLLLARDRLGIKPMYYYLSPQHFFFGSELKAIIAHPAVPRDIDLVALDYFLTLEYVPGPRTIFNNIYKLPPGHRLIIEDGACRLEKYWAISYQSVPADEESCGETLAELIRDAVRMQLVADVPLGAFLSGGIDSSTVVAFMSQASDKPVQSFSIGFGDATYNELPYARLVAGAFGAQHHEEHLQPDVATLAEQLVTQFDEPFADFSIFPTYLVAQLARKSVKVVLSGDGGDELFAGYDTYVAQKLAHRYYDWLPGALRRNILPGLLDLLPPQPAKKGMVNKAKRFVEGAALPAAWQHTRWMMFINQSDKVQLYRPEVRLALNGDVATTTLLPYFEQAGHLDPLAQQQYVDVKTYLVDDILTKVDRMSMAVSLEARVPLLDHRIVEFALNLPPQMKLRGGTTKVLLRRAVAGLLPAEVLAKPKQGFSIPLKHWLRGPLRPLLTDLLSASTIGRDGYFEPQCVTRWISEHLDGRANHSHRLWALMVFTLWKQQVMEGVRNSPGTI
jgi:asparagine synthase (glutamine-hydrolysing)